jgi:hypothetical protein
MSDGIYDTYQAPKGEEDRPMAKAVCRHCLTEMIEVAGLPYCDVCRDGSADPLYVIDQMW